MIKIIFTHPRNDDFLSDPTHVRPITILGLQLFDKELNLEWEKKNAANSPLALINNVDFNVGGKTKVKNVSFSIENEGDVICLLGPSGIGKTTILRTIAGLEKINKGSIKLNGKLISSEKINVEPENRNVSLAFQDNSLFPHYTVEKNIHLGAQAKKPNGKKKISPNKIIKLLNIEKI